MIDEYIVESEEYVGLGSGAFSFLDGTLYVNTFSLQGIRAGHRRAGTCRFRPARAYGRREQMRYRFMMELFGLRFDRQRFKQIFGVPAEWGLCARDAVYGRWWALSQKSRARPSTLTPRGKYLSVVMMREFFSGVNNVRDEARKALSDEERQCALPVNRQTAHRERIRDYNLTLCGLHHTTSNLK